MHSIVNSLSVLYFYSLFLDKYFYLMVRIISKLFIMFHNYQFLLPFFQFFWMSFFAILNNSLFGSTMEGAVSLWSCSNAKMWSFYMTKFSKSAGRKCGSDQWPVLRAPAENGCPQLLLGTQSQYDHHDGATYRCYTVEFL